MVKNGQHKKPVVLDSCTGCGYCYLVCPEKAIRTGSKILIDNKSCNLCGKCK